MLYNPFAAVPSMHVAFALMIAVPAIFLVKRRVLKVLWAIYPFVVTFVVMVTANHFWLDAALGALVAALSGYAAYAAFAALPAPEAWAWQHRQSMSIRTGADDARARARNRLIESRLTPNAISLTGLVGNLIAAVLILEHHFVLAGIAFILGSLCDMFDGRYSRMSGKGTPFGAFLDSTLDRVEEGIVLAAVAAWFAENSNEFAVGATVVAVVGSYMVSYTRARAEALGVECKVGIASRAVRVVILSAGWCSARRS